MQAGKLKDRVSLQQPETAQDDEGQSIPTWTEVVKLWANVRYVSGIEAVRSGAVASTSKVSIQIRQRAGVVPTMRIVDAQGVTYQIESVLPDRQTRDRINLVCEVIA